MKQTKYYKEYLKALREDVRALERRNNDKHKDTIDFKGCNLFALPPIQKAITATL